MAHDAPDFQGELTFETLIADLSSRFINLLPVDVDREIEDALRRVCEPLGIDLAVLWQWASVPPAVIVPTHAWCVQEGLRPSGPMREEDYPWSVQQVLAGRMFAIATPDELPAEATADRETCRRFGIKSAVCLPLSVGGEPPVGALGFNSLRAARDWPDTLLKRLQLVAQVFANALARRRHELSLQESEERLALAADSAEAGLWTLDYSTGVFWATERARTIFGYSPDEGITTDSLQASVHPEDWGVVRRAIERSRSTDEPLDVEYRIAAPGASRPRWISSRGRPVRDPDGAVKRLTGISFDVTGRKLAEQESRERLEFETLIADLSSRFINLPAGDVDREIEDAQRRVCEVLGIDLSALWQGTAADGTPLTLTHFYAAEEGLLPPLRGMSAEELFPWLQGEMLAGRAVCVSSLEGLPPEAALDRDNLRRFGVRSNLTLPLSVGGASTVAALGFNSTRSEREWPESLVKRLRLVGQVFANALARRRTEEALEAGRDRLEAATDLAGLAFYEVDFAAQTVFVDDGFRRLTGVPPEREEAGLGPVHFWMEQVLADDRDRVLEQRRQLHDGTQERLNTEYRFLHPTRGEVWFHHVARVTRRDPTGWVVRTFGVLRDITERRVREEALGASLAEIQRLKDRLQAESDYLKAEIKVVHPNGEVTGQSPAIQKVLRLVEQVAPTDSSVLVRGETGSGKELVAQAIHRQSPRRGHLMVKVNCAALPSGLVESELFGREKGAFTGAMTRQIGRFEVADGSTLFLDEIGELSLEVQAKLLRVLETGEFERLGSPKTIKVDVRLVAATNRDLQEEVRQGRFREDLYYRLNVFPIRVPPLRERQEDIPLLVWTFLEELSSRMGKRITQVPRRTMEALQRHPWPGNVRELKNVIEHGAIVTSGDTLRVPMLDEVAPAGAGTPTLADSERELIHQALQKARWRIKGPAGAAAALGLNPSTLYSRMKKLGIRPPGPAEDGSR